MVIRVGDRSLVLGTAILVLSLLPACSSAPPAELYFDKRTPVNVVDALRYSIEAHQLSFAFDCLTEESREGWSPSHLILLRWRDVVGVSFHDLIVNAQRDGRPPFSGDEARIYLYFDGKNDAGVDTYIPLDVHVVRNAATGLWSVDLLASAGLE